MSRKPTLIIEARSRAITALDRARFAPFEALFGGPAVSPEQALEALRKAQAGLDREKAQEAGERARAFARSQAAR